MKTTYSLDLILIYVSFTDEIDKKDFNQSL